MLCPSDGFINASGGKERKQTNGSTILDKDSFFRRRRLFAHVSQGRHPIIPFFQHSIIQIVSAAN
jgi:hypothetical protein